MKKLSILAAVLFFTLPALVFAKIGVGIGTGKIVLDQPLRPGLIYSLPVITIINTGDEPSEYSVSITHRENQSEMKPPLEWFSFEPKNFFLEPGKSQQVQVKLNLPIKDVRPGEYFVFLEGHPTKTSNVNGTSIGVAAAAKLYFTVAPSNIFAGTYYRLASLFSIYAPWTYVVSAVLAAALLIVILRRYVSLNIGFSVKKKNE